MGGDDHYVPVAVPVSSYTTPPVVTNATAPTAPPLGLNHQQSSFYVATSFKASNQFNQYQVEQLKAQGYSKGLIHELLLTTQTFSYRFWVVDNSGSMNHTDGKRFVNSSNPNKIKMASCTRWKEIQEAVDYHAQMSALLQIPTTFRLLNNPGAHVGPQEFSIGVAGPGLIQQDLERARRTMANGEPTGVTPLAKHVKEIREQVYSLTPMLQEQGRKVVIILATDGLPTNDYGIAGREANDEFTNAMKSLEGLPVWIVVRLCTNEDKVVEFYNSVDAQLELSIEVVDDYLGEAEEIDSKNPWVNYTLPLHRMREMGTKSRLLDLLDERKFTLSEVYDFCVLLFGLDAMSNVPDPEGDFSGFCKKLSKVVDKEKKQWNPTSKAPKSLIDVKEIGKIYGDGSCVIM